MDRVVIEDYVNTMAVMDENVSWMKLTHVLSSISLNLWAPLVNLLFLQIPLPLNGQEAKSCCECFPKIDLLFK